MTNVANMTQKMPGKPAANGKKDIILSAVFLLLCLMIWLLPTGFEKKVDQRAIRCKGQVAAVDNQNVIQHGMVKTGEQKVVVEIKSGPFEGRTFKTENQLLGQMDRDKIFAPGDMAFVVLTLDTDGNVVFVNPQEHYRIGIEIFLLCLFALLLIAFGGVTGLKALLSFLFAALVIWKILIPSLLKGWDPILVTLGVTATLCGAIIFLVAGVNRKGATAFAGSFAGVLTSCGLAYFFTGPLHLHGAVMPFAETLLYSGFGHLDLTRIYIAAVFIACSGAVMDLGVDVAASMNEVVEKYPAITRVELIKSGLNVGRAVAGTMTTTLLLAYSGGFITLLMAFMAQGIPLSSTFNIIYVAAEVLKTIVGSFALVTVAPFTALLGGFILLKKP
ncbi:MAG: YibE/F family protein [Desulfotignum sp.]